MKTRQEIKDEIAHLDTKLEELSKDKARMTIQHEYQLRAMKDILLWVLARDEEKYHGRPAGEKENPA